jgi:hypothetical protein
MRLLANSNRARRKRPSLKSADWLAGFDDGGLLASAAPCANSGTADGRAHRQKNRSRDNSGSDNRRGSTNSSDRPRLTQATVVGPPGETTMGIYRWRIIAHIVSKLKSANTFASPFRAPVNRRSREPALVTHSARVAPIPLQPDLVLAGWWASSYLCRKGLDAGPTAGCSPPPKLGDTGWSGLGVWRTTRSKGALTSMPSSSADAESGARAEIMRRSGHGDRTHYIRHHHD